MSVFTFSRIIASRLTPLPSTAFITSNTTTRFTRADIGISPYKILRSIFVPLWAMSFLSIKSQWITATQCIATVCCDFYVRGISARRDITQMVAFQLQRNGGNKQDAQSSMPFINLSLNPNRSVLVGRDTSVLFRVQPTGSVVAHINNSDMRENLYQQFMRNIKTVIIASSHSVYSYLVNNLVRLVQGTPSLVRAVLV